MKTLILIFIILLFGTGSVLAFGISSPYHKNKPLELTPGEEKEISFNLQNCPSLKEFCNEGNVDILVSSFEEGSEIAEVKSGIEYSLPFGSHDENIILKISIPESAKVGDSYNIKLSVNPIPIEAEKGNVQLGVKYNIDFPVNIIEEPVKSPETLVKETKRISSIGIIIAITILISTSVLLFILIMVLRNVSRESEQEISVVGIL